MNLNRFFQRALLTAGLFVGGLTVGRTEISNTHILWVPDPAINEPLTNDAPQRSDEFRLPDSNGVLRAHLLPRRNDPTSQAATFAFLSDYFTDLNNDFDPSKDPARAHKVIVGLEAIASVLTLGGDKDSFYQRSGLPEDIIKKIDVMHAWSAAYETLREYDRIKEATTTNNIHVAYRAIMRMGDAHVHWVYYALRHYKRHSPDDPRFQVDLPTMDDLHGIRRNAARLVVDIAIALEYTKIAGTELDNDAIATIRRTTDLLRLASDPETHNPASGQTHIYDRQILPHIREYFQEKGYTAHDQNFYLGQLFGQIGYRYEDIPRGIFTEIETQQPSTTPSPG